MAKRRSKSTSASSRDLANARNADDVGGSGGGGRNPEGPGDPGFGQAPGAVRVELQRPGRVATDDQPLWVAIRNRTNAISFSRYSAFIEAVLCRGDFDGDDAESLGTFGSPSVEARRTSLASRKTLLGADSYKLLRLATEAFLIVECGIFAKDGALFSDESDLKPHDTLINTQDEAARFAVADIDVDELSSMLKSYVDAPTSYLRRIAAAVIGTATVTDDDEVLPFCNGVLQGRVSCPSMIELIWSYWHEQGMLMQSMNAILKRFQNKRHGPDDPLVNFELDPLRGMNNLLWGFLQDEANRLSVARRAYEYDHHYGLNLLGKSVGQFHPADSRVRFIEAFHTLLYRTMMFYREDDDTTVVADGFAMLNALREVHIVLSEGAHNQYGDLPWQARKEMLITQWLLSRQEVREFIRGRHMVPYQETWMGPVDDMKRLQGWTDVSATHFHELGRYGEQILLSVRFGNWMQVNDQNHARNWAQYWRPEIQRYIHAYSAVTGVDLSLTMSDSRSAEERVRQPSELMVERNRMRPLGRRKSQALPRPRKGGNPKVSAPRAGLTVRK